MELTTVHYDRETDTVLIDFGLGKTIEAHFMTYKVRFDANSDLWETWERSELLSLLPDIYSETVAERYHGRKPKMKGWELRFYTPYIVPEHEERKYEREKFTCTL